MWPVVFRLKLVHDLLNVSIAEGCKLPGGINGQFITRPQHSGQVRKVAGVLMSILLAQLAQNRCCPLSAATIEGNVRAHGRAACHCQERLPAATELASFCCLSQTGFNSSTVCSSWENQVQTYRQTGKTHERTKCKETGRQTDSQGKTKMACHKIPRRKEQNQW